MADYSDGKNILLGRPEPGRPEKKEVIVQEAKVDADAIADAVVKAIGDRIPTGLSAVQGESVSGESFDTSESLDKLAEAMVVQRGEGESNFDNLGKVNKTKKDDETVDKTIDLLSNLED